MKLFTCFLAAFVATAAAYSDGSFTTRQIHGVGFDYEYQELDAATLKRRSFLEEFGPQLEARGQWTLRGAIRKRQDFAEAVSQRKAELTERANTTRDAERRAQDYDRRWYNYKIHMIRPERGFDRQRKEAHDLVRASEEERLAARRRLRQAEARLASLESDIEKCQVLRRRFALEIAENMIDKGQNYM